MGVKLDQQSDAEAIALLKGRVPQLKFTLGHWHSFFKKGAPSQPPNHPVTIASQPTDQPTSQPRAHHPPIHHRHSQANSCVRQCQSMSTHAPIQLPNPPKSNKLPKKSLGLQCWVTTVAASQGSRLEPLRLPVASLASLLLAMALVPVATSTELVPTATQAGADAASSVPGAEAQAGVAATTVTFDVYMPQFGPVAFPPSRWRCLRI